MLSHTLMLLKRIYILLFFSILCNAALLATHIVGGEIFYDYLGNDDYRVTIKVYRDCFNGVAPFDNPLSLGIYDSHGTLVRNELVSLPGYTKLPPTLNNPCFQPPTNVCVEEAIYTVVVKLPPIAGGYYLAYQRCCRNKTISNLISPGLVGSTYFTQVLDPAIVTINNSPRFKNFPPLFLCAGVPLVFDHSATDADGDSLAYELCDPYLGADSASPMPSPPMPPPYTNVPFKAPYSGTYPMSAKPPISINPKTGLLTGTPNMIGQWVVGVC